MFRFSLMKCISFGDKKSQRRKWTASLYTTQKVAYVSHIVHTYLSMTRPRVSGQTFTLEKLDSGLILQHEGRGAPKNRQPSASRESLL